MQFLGCKVAHRPTLTTSVCFFHVVDLSGPASPQEVLAVEEWKMQNIQDSHEALLCTIMGLGVFAFYRVHVFQKANLQNTATLFHLKNDFSKLPIISTFI